MERWTIRQPISGVHDCHINSSGPYPASFGKFEYRVSFDLTAEAVDVTHPDTADLRTREHVPSIRKGVERALSLFRTQGELVTSVRIDVLQVTRHPTDPDLRGSSHGMMLIGRLLSEHGRPDPKPDSAWLTPTVLALAVGIYAERAFDRLPILADALEEAGCDHADILAHCRGDGPHARGCWVVDLMLGKS
jgi:hypothetical protein